MIRKPLLVNSIQEWDALGGSTIPGTDTSLSLLAVPIIGSDRVVGSIKVENYERETAYSESFNSRLRDELLERELFTSEAEARVLLEDHRRQYNEERPHSSLGGKTPAEFAEAWRASNHVERSESDAHRSPRIDDLDPGRVSSTPELAGAGLS